MEEQTLYKVVTDFGIIEFNKYHVNNLTSYRLYIDGALQFDSKDEYRYHQTLFSLPFLMLGRKRKYKILVLGGGDGLGVRELLKLKEYFRINMEITLVDISKEILFLAQNIPQMKELNKNSLNNPKVTVINQDAKEFIEKTAKDGTYDLIILDYPDPIPQPTPIDELFTAEHYKKVSKKLKPNGIMALQATSVKLMPNSLRKVELEIEKVYNTRATARIDVPSFGDIAVIIAKNSQDKGFGIRDDLPPFLFFTLESVNNFFNFYEDEKPTIKDEILQKCKIWKILHYDIFRNKLFE